MHLLRLELDALAVNPVLRESEFQQVLAFTNAYLKGPLNQTTFIRTKVAELLGHSEHFLRAVAELEPEILVSAGLELTPPRIAVLQELALDSANQRRYLQYLFFVPEDDLASDLGEYEESAQQQSRKIHFGFGAEWAGAEKGSRVVRLPKSQVNLRLKAALASRVTELLLRPEKFEAEQYRSLLLLARRLQIAVDIPSQYAQRLQIESNQFCFCLSATPSVNYEAEEVHW